MLFSRMNSFVVMALCLVSFSSAMVAAGKPELRLPDMVAPTGCRADLSLDPAKDTFSGEIIIYLEIKQPVQTIWLNATDIAVSAASLKIGSQTLPAKAATSGEDFLSLGFAAPLPKGKGELTIRYSGKVRQQSIRIWLAPF